jgi:uncharacterized protein YkwD
MEAGLARIFRGAASAAALLSVGAVCPAIAEPPFNPLSGAVDMEPQVLMAINFVRTHPAEYAQRLRGAPPTAATLEAIGELERRSPAPPLRFNPDLAASAVTHAEDQGRHDAFAHTGSDGSSAAERMHGRGVYAGMLAEAMSAGEPTADEVVRQLIVDEGVPGRGHRKDLLDPFLSRAGVGCAPHPTWRVICVIDLASAAPPRD